MSTSERVDAVEAIVKRLAKQAPILGAIIVQSPRSDPNTIAILIDFYADGILEMPNPSERDVVKEVLVSLRAAMDCIDESVHTLEWML